MAQHTGQQHEDEGQDRGGRADDQHGVEQQARPRPPGRPPRPDLDLRDLAQGRHVPSSVVSCQLSVGTKERGSTEYWGDRPPSATGDWRLTTRHSYTTR